jgi:hypothetical protein
VIADCRAQNTHPESRSAQQAHYKRNEKAAFAGSNWESGVAKLSDPGKD